MQPAGVSCTLPEVLAQLKKGERIWFDDGRIGGVIRRVASRGVDVEIADIADGSASLAADKGKCLAEVRVSADVRPRRGAARCRAALRAGRPRC